MKCCRTRLPIHVCRKAATAFPGVWNYVQGHFELHIYRMPSFVKNGKRSKAGKDAPIYADAPQGILPGSNMGASIIALALHNKYTCISPSTAR